jgi:D-glucosaminate-6-phosphate ammonia-lyase
MMSPGEDKIVADRVHAILSARRPAKSPEPSKPPSADLTGRWDVHIEFAAGSGDHVFYVKQQDGQLVGTHQGDFVARDFSGTIAGDDVQISSSIGEVHGAALSYRFSGKLNGDTMSGTLDMGEYLGARFTAKRHAFGGRQAGDIG